MIKIVTPRRKIEKAQMWHMPLGLQAIQGSISDIFHARGNDNHIVFQGHEM